MIQPSRFVAFIILYGLVVAFVFSAAPPEVCQGSTAQICVNQFIGSAGLTSFCCIGEYTPSCLPGCYVCKSEAGSESLSVAFGVTPYSYNASDPLGNGYGFFSVQPLNQSWLLDGSIYPVIGAEIWAGYAVTFQPSGCNSVGFVVNLTCIDS